MAAREGARSARAPARGSVAGRAPRAARARLRSRSRTRSGSPRRRAAGSGRRCRRRRTRRLGGRAQAVREPVALVADGVALQAARDLLRRLLDVVARLVGADADALLAVGAGPTRRSRCGSGSGRSRRRGRCRSPCGWTSRPREIAASGGWTLAPGPRTRRQPSASTISGAVRSPRSVRTRRAVAVLDLGDLESRVASAPTAPGRARGSRSSTSSTAAGSAPSRAACGRPCTGSPGGSRARRPSRAATASAPRTRTSARSPIS